MVTDRVPFIETMTLGSGYDSVNGDVRDRALIEAAHESEHGGSGSEVVFEWRSCTFQEDFEKMLDVKAGMSLTFGLLGGVFVVCSYHQSAIFLFIELMR
jgi:hypothetical protein